MNIAILGYGSIANTHARTILALASKPGLSDVRLYGVAGPKEEPTAAFAKEFEMATAVTDVDDLLNDPEVDIVVICSPTDLHADQTEKALRSGKHVLCEIPLATSLTETDRLIALAEQMNLTLMVCHTQRYSAAMLEAKRMIDAGELHPHSIVSRYMFGRRQNINWKGRQRSWTDNLLWHHGCHAVDAALWLLGASERGETVDTVAQIALPGQDLDIPMDLGLVMRTGRDQIATVAMSYHTNISLHDVVIIGEETTLLFAENQLRDHERVIVPSPDEGESESANARQNEEFFRAILDGREPAVSGRSVRPAMAALQAAQEALDARIAEVGSEQRHSREP